MKDSYNVSRLAQVAACAALSDREYAAATRNRIVATRGMLTERLARLGFTVLPSRANFIFAVPPAPRSARELYDRLLGRGYLVRYFDSPELRDGLRISVGSEDETDSLLAAVQEEMDGRQ